MVYLLLSIISSTCIFLIFKQFEKHGINNLQAIVVNYFTAAIIGFIVGGKQIEIAVIVTKSWFVVAVVIGILFITMFNVIAITAQKLGVAAATVASKVSLIIPVIFAVFLYDDSMPIPKAAGVVMALFSVFLTFYPPVGGMQLQMRKYFFLPVILFFGTGLLDTIVKFAQDRLLTESEFSAFSSILFIVAGFIGLLAVAFDAIQTRVSGQKETRCTVYLLKNVLAGIVLGIPNYGSIYFLLKTFENSNMESSVIFPVNNMAIVGLSSLAAFFLFKEKLSIINSLGIALAILSIAIISFS